jgi:hypothetical protein
MTVCGKSFPKEGSVRTDIPCSRPEGHLGDHQAFQVGYYTYLPEMVACFQWNLSGSRISPIRDEKGEYRGICVECDIRVQGEQSTCSGCYFWLDHIKHTADRRIVVNGAHYLVGRVGGFGGAKWVIEFIDPMREGFTTNQLWYQGTIPSHFRDRIPDNARFIKEKLEIPSSSNELEKDIQNGN